MIFVKPDFYDDFKCKASECTDTCCAGWEVDIDSDSLGKYKAVGGSFGKRLIENIIYDEGAACFSLKEGERCAFHNDNGLCDVYSTLGADFLCEICREHPRFYDFFDGITEMGIGLCCEKVCELLFENDASVSFLLQSDEVDDKFNEEDRIYFNIRENCFDILKNREISLDSRIENLLRYIILVQNECFADSYEFKNVDKKQFIHDVVDLFEETEPINAQWTNFIIRIKSGLAYVNAPGISENEYERILTYIIYRHFMQSRFTGNVIAPVAFAVVSLAFIYICDCISSLDKINNLKLWSKQIEYSAFNTDFLLQKSFELFVI